MTAPIFLFCEALSTERLSWLRHLLSGGSRGGEVQPAPSATLFLTGDALYSLLDRRTRPAIHALAALPGIRIVADRDEIRLTGIPIEGGERVLVPEDFWNEVVETGPPVDKGEKAAFLLCHGPYMSRIPVYMVRFLSRALAAGRTPELYLYLDGVHVGHEGQRPSEFANIARSVSEIHEGAAGRGHLPWFGACSRCATARGYYVQNPATASCEPSGVISAVTVRPLREILGRFFSGHPILSHGCGNVPGGGGTPRLVICLTTTPYLAEWTFGGLSMATAAAMEGIPTTVLFLEDGVYSLVGAHSVAPEDRLFNIQEMIAATSDVEDLEYFVYSPSLSARGVSISDDLGDVHPVGEEGISDVVLGLSGDACGRQVRILLF